MRQPRLLTRRGFAKLSVAAGAGAGLCQVLPALTSSIDSSLTGYGGAGTSRASTASKIEIAGADSLRAHGLASGIQFGCAAVPALLDLGGAQAGVSDDPYTQIVRTQASILVAENSMKWGVLRPTATTFDFGDADKLLEFAALSEQLVRGHNLCWHEHLPAWFHDAVTKENAQEFLSHHIETVAGRYAGRIHSWDVVNEAVHIPDGRSDGLRKSPWLELLGPEYIELAFTAASKADPKAKLTYNDYAIELDTPEQSAKRGQVLMLLRRLHARAIPIQAVGIQSHLEADGPQPGQGIVDFIREAAKMNLEVYVTEMDVNTHRLEGGDAMQDEAVAKVYRDYLRLVLREPNVKAVLMWGICDAHTWLNESKEKWATRPDGMRQRPLPFDDEYRPTSAFVAIRDALDYAKQARLQMDGMVPKKLEEPFTPFAVPGSPHASSKKVDIFLKP